MKLPDLSSACILFISLLSVFLYSTAKGWFHIHKRWTIGILGGLTLLFPVTLLGYFYFFGQIYQKERILALNPNALIFPISAKTGEGLDAVCEWILSEVKTIKR